MKKINIGVIESNINIGIIYSILYNIDGISLYITCNYY